MEKKNCSVRFLFHAGLANCALALGSLLKVSYIVGSKAAFFKVANIISPLIGLFGGIGLSCSLLIFSLFKGLSIVGGLNPFLYLLYHIPGFCGALYFALRGPVIRLFLPLLCMGLFIAHPVGGQAYLYSFYWLIPVALYFVRHKAFFLDALSCTFVMHAVGSIVYLYTIPMPAPVWLGLIPVVFGERFLFALGITGFYYVVTAVKNFGRAPRFFAKKLAE